MKITAIEIKPGMIIEHKNDYWNVLKTQHVKPGKGGAFAQVELKNLRDNTKLNERFRSSETVERVILEEKKATYLYEDGDKLIFMDAISFEQKFLLKGLIGEKSELLEDGMEVILNSFDDEVISVDLPDTIIVEILDADAVVKGQTRRRRTVLFTAGQCVCRVVVVAVIAGHDSVAIRIIEQRR